MAPEVKGALVMVMSPHAAGMAAQTRSLNATMAAPGIGPAQMLRATSIPALKIQNYEFVALRKDGSRIMTQVKVPAHSLFDSAFSAFARGCLLQSVNGEIAIEDLVPGDMLWTASGAPAKVLWVGSGNFVPADTGRRVSMVRVMADSFGECRPDGFLSLGTHARILQTPSHMRAETGNQSLLTKITEFVDGENVIEVVPPTAVRLFHVVLERHAVIKVDGLECESFHPGMQATREVSHAMRDLFLSMFPHISHVSDFGPLAHPRARESNNDVVIEDLR